MRLEAYYYSDVEDQKPSIDLLADSAVDANSINVESEPSFMVHSTVYAMAEMYSIEGLKAAAVAKLTYACGGGDRKSVV